MIQTLLNFGGNTPNSIPEVTTLAITVTNTGNVAGSDVVLAMMVPPNAGQDGIALSFLFGFERVFLQPGQDITIQFPVSPTALSIVNKDGNRMTQKGLWKIFIGNVFLTCVDVI